MSSEDKKISPNEIVSMRLLHIGYIAVVVALLSIIPYITIFSKAEVSTDGAHWANFGEYIGGVLSPIFAFAALIALLYSISIQSNELNKSVNALQNQNKIIERQNFEATFFQMMRFYNEIVQQLRITKPDDITERGAIEGKAAITYLLKKLNFFHKVKYPGKEETVISRLNNDYEAIYQEYGNYIGHYFRMIYNILKFINNSKLDNAEKIFYTNILRAQLSQDELVLIFYNSISNYGKEKMLPLVKKYNLLKHIALSPPGDLNFIEEILTSNSNMFSKNN